MTQTTIEIILYALAAGAAIPVGAALASKNAIHKGWLETEFRHAVMAFGAGTLLAAVSFVLVPHAIDQLSLLESAASFFAGGVVLNRPGIAGDSIN